MPLDGCLLAGVTVFSAVIEYGSFARAGEALGISASGVSHAIARLEMRMGVRLIERTTRAMSPTEEGSRFYERVRPSLEGIADAAADASVSTVKVRSRLKVSIDPCISGRSWPDVSAGFATPRGKFQSECSTPANECRNIGRWQRRS
jgi:DNA-binding transcriptional LysR family regulator